MRREGILLQYAQGNTPILTCMNFTQQLSFEDTVPIKAISNMIYHWTGSIIYTSVYSMVYLFNAFSSVLYPVRIQFCVRDEKRHSPTKEKAPGNSTFQVFWSAGLHFHCVKKRVFLLARLTFLMLCRLSGGRFLATTFRWPASQIISALRSMELA